MTELNNLQLRQLGFRLNPELMNKLFNTDKDFNDEEIKSLLLQLFFYDTDLDNKTLFSDLFRTLFKPKLIIEINHSGIECIIDYPIELLKNKDEAIKWVKEKYEWCKTAEHVDIFINQTLCKIIGYDQKFSRYYEWLNISEIIIK